MGDIIDEANELMEKELQDLLDMVKQANRPEREYDKNKIYKCVDCNIILPQERAEMGKPRCVFCQQEFEYHEERRKKLL